MGKGILVSPTVDGNLLLGPTSVDKEDKENKDTSAEGFAEILTKAKEYVENLPAGKVITSFCGLRAAGNTGCAASAQSCNQAKQYSNNGVDLDAHCECGCGYGSETWYAGSTDSLG